MASILSQSAWRLIVLAVVGLGAFILAAPRFEIEAPGIDAPESVILGRAGGVLRFQISDAGTGVRSYSLRLRHGGGAIDLHEEQFAGNLFRGAAQAEAPQIVEIPLGAEILGLGDGSATLILTARDFSWQDNLRGNRSERAIPLTIDTRPPGIQPGSGLTYIYRGGAGAALYRVDESTARDGVLVAEDFFRGYPLPGAPADSGQRIALFAVSVSAPSNPKIEIEAVDMAGNSSRVRFAAARVNERRFPREDITLGKSFFENVIPALARKIGVEAPSPIEAFQIINSDVRAQNESQIRELIRESAGEQLWRGGFKQMANSKVMSRFAESRHYFVEDRGSDGREISQATHYGFDLASNARAPITASNAGRVLFADDLGIYGQCVMIDHGLGLVSLYGHLSSIEVAPGDALEKNQVLGRSGATGLAGGDHLHFAILVGNTYVDPIEWWDARWVQSHVGVRLTSSNP